MSSGWDNYREAINNEWLLETPYNALKCITDAKLERYELIINRKLSLEERKEMGFEFKLLSPLIMSTKESYFRPKDSNDPAGGYSSWDFCFRDEYSISLQMGWNPKPDYYVYDFYNFKEYNNFFDFSFNKFLDILGHDIIVNVYSGLIVPEIEKGARIIDRRYFIQEYELLRRMLFISREAYCYMTPSYFGGISIGSDYLYNIYFNNASETMVKRYEESIKKFNSLIESYKNEEEEFWSTRSFNYYYTVQSLARIYGFSFDVHDNEYYGYCNRGVYLPFCRVDVIPIKKVRCIIVNKYGGLNDLYKRIDNNLKKDYQYTNSGSFILNDGTSLNKENSIFIVFDDFIDSNDTQEDIDNKVIRRNDLYDLFSPILKEPSKSEFADYKSYLDNIIPNPPDPKGDYIVSITNRLILSNKHSEYSYVEQKWLFIDSYSIACYDYLAGGELEFDDDGLYSSGDSSSDNNEEKDTTDNTETNNNTES